MHHSNEFTSTLTKYNTDPSYGNVDNKTVLDADDDAAMAVLGSTWRMPTGGDSGEWQQLRASTYFVWVYDYKGINGLNGFVVHKVKDRDDKGLMTLYDGSSWVTYNVDREKAELKGSYNTSAPHMFLPAAGYYNECSLNFVGFSGYYWSSSLDADYPPSAYDMDFGSGYVFPQNNGYGRYYGLPVRPVR